MTIRALGHEARLPPESSAPLKRVQQPPPHVASKVILELVGIERHFGRVPAVCGIDLSVREGEFVTLLGPSGSGKTTTLMMIAGFEEPDAGDIRMGGQSILKLPPNKRNIGIVFQNYALFPHMTVR